jgi:hypothetical protein
LQLSIITKNTPRLDFWHYRKFHELILPQWICQCFHKSTTR